MAGHGLRGVNIRQRLDEDELDGQELRTLTFGDRTISYDTGLNFAPKYGERSKQAHMPMQLTDKCNSSGYDFYLQNHMPIAHMITSCLSSAEDFMCVLRLVSLHCFSDTSRRPLAC